jgi:glycine betaine/choline ABC-type transport system substrate-binding protein
MKFENNWKNKSLENLEKDIWPSLSEDEGSYLIQTCHQLRKKQLKDFEIEDLRIMIGQNIGLDFLIPLAIDELELDILAEGNFYEGDLLKNILTSDKEYWKREKKNWAKVCELFNKNESKMTEFNTSRKIKKGWFDSFNEFAKINK